VRSTRETPQAGTDPMRQQAMPSPRGKPLAVQPHAPTPYQQPVPSRPTTPAPVASKRVSEPRPVRRKAIEPHAPISASHKRLQWLPRRLQRSPTSLPKVILGVVAVVLLGTASWLWGPDLGSAGATLSSLWSSDADKPQSYTRPSYRSYEPSSFDAGRRWEGFSSTGSRGTGGNDIRETGSNASPSSGRPTYRAPATSIDRGRSPTAPVAVPQ